MAWYEDCPGERIKYVSMYKNSKHTIIFPLVLAVGIVLGILLGQFVGRNKAESQLRSLISRTGLTAPNKLMQTCMLVEN